MKGLCAWGVRFLLIQLRSNDDSFSPLLNTECDPTRRPHFTYLPNTLQEILGAWLGAIDRLIERGVTGKILLANLASLKGLPVSPIGLRNASAYATSYIHWNCLETRVLRDERRLESIRPIALEGPNTKHASTAAAGSP